MESMDTEDSKNRKKPHGKAEVKEALIDAASTLFAEKGVEAVSLRMIADHAGVNLGLIHRHFGTKEALRRETQEKLSADVRSLIGDPEDLMDTLFRGLAVIQENDKFWRVMARTLLDDKDHGEIQSSFPFVRKLVERVEQEQQAGRITEKVDAKGIVTAFLAYGLGLLVFKGYILPAVGMEKESSEKPIQQMSLQLLSLFEKNRTA